MVGGGRPVLSDSLVIVSLELGRGSKPAHHHGIIPGRLSSNMSNRA
jgi:hypothetical protein